jgi:hypothetical protein
MGHRSKIILAASAKSVVAPLAPVVPSPSTVRVATTVSKPRKVPTPKAAALLEAVQDLIANDPKVADAIEDAPLQPNYYPQTPQVLAVFDNVYTNIIYIHV